MKKLTIIFILIFLNVTISFSQQDEFEIFLKRLDHKEFFKLKNHLPFPAGWQEKYASAIITGVFNMPGESNSLINELLADQSIQMADTVKMMLLEQKTVNSLFLGNYKDAFETQELLMDKYVSYMDAEEKGENENSLIMFEAYKDMPAQETSIKDASSIDYKRDLAGLIDMEVKINGNIERFKFDTGANISTVSRSVAEKNHMKFLKGKLMVGTATGDKTNAEIAFAESLSFGNVTIKNIAFIVLPDESLSFGGGFYVIDGIIGIPVIRSLGEVDIKKDNIVIPLTPKTGFTPNLAFDNFMPVVELVYKSDSLVFSFDSGARKTMLNLPFFEKYKKEIVGKYKLTETEFEGAGTSKKVKAYEIPKIKFRMGTGQAEIEDTKAVIEAISKKDYEYYGNLGQDFFTSFKEIDINFSVMTIDAK